MKKLAAILCLLASMTSFAGEIRVGELVIFGGTMAIVAGKYPDGSVSVKSASGASVRIAAELVARTCGSINGLGVNDIVMVYGRMGRVTGIFSDGNVTVQVAGFGSNSVTLHSADVALSQKVGSTQECIN